MYLKITHCLSLLLFALVHKDLNNVQVILKCLVLFFFKNQERGKQGGSSEWDVWQHVQLSEHIRPWDTLGCGWDVKQATKQSKAKLLIPVRDDSPCPCLSTPVIHPVDHHFFFHFFQVQQTRDHTQMWLLRQRLFLPSYSHKRCCNNRTDRTTRVYSHDQTWSMEAIQVHWHSSEVSLGEQTSLACLKDQLV